MAFSRQARAGEPGASTTGSASEPIASAKAVRFAFYGRTARNDADNASASQHWQEGSCRAAVAAHGGQVTAWFFDTACPADRPWRDRPQGGALIAALAGPHRHVNAVVAANGACLRPRRQGSEGADLLGWLANRNVPLLLADTDITISSPQEYDLIEGLLSGLGGLPEPAQASLAAMGTRMGARSAPRGRPAAYRSRAPLPEGLLPGLPGISGTGRPR